jgi:hypothetical protein
MRKLPQFARSAGIARFLSRTDDPMLRTISYSNKNFAAMAAEENGIRQSMAELRSAQLSLGNKPVIVIASEQNNRYDFWKRAQQDFLKFSTRSEQIIAPGGHNIPRNHPDLVVSSIRKVVEDVRSEGRATSDTAQ